ncbi:MAG: hypothetical protein H0U59_13265 [Gemmatimonadaceae bacterium]|nr:hypothetical protein [Gemmatimonadaceae bacterium]
MFRLTTAKPSGRNLDSEVARGDDGSLITVRIPDSATLNARAFERATTDAYNTIKSQLGDQHPVRFWNHIPAIHAVMDCERDRYMVFNAGRFRAFESWYGSSAAFSRHVATASGVGHAGRDLVVHCLATAQPGTAIENSRQIASYEYSRRYGPLPPCFARATTIHTRTYPRGLVLIGGTASIRGEDSIHLDSLSLQLDETFENLARLVTAARKSDHQPDDSAPLAQYRCLRIYYRHQHDVPAILDAVQSAFPSLQSLEVIHAELCRAELLVEIEGIAQL